jgi:hypothetical protein
MLRIPWRVQLGLVACGYALVFGIAGILIAQRYLQYANNPADVAASSGMYAGGDLLLELFIASMLLVVSFVLVLVIFRSETAYTTYSKVLVAISLTAPVSVGLIAIPDVNQGSSVLGYACLFRLFASPMVLLGLGMSRLFARFSKAKRFTTYALLIETLTLVFLVVMLVLPAHLPRG